MAARSLKLVHDAGAGGFVDPADLHKHLPVTQTREISFPTEKRLTAYRKMLYSVNKQATYRYRTMRAESGPYVLAVWRMK